MCMAVGVVPVGPSDTARNRRSGYASAGRENLTGQLVLNWQVVVRALLSRRPVFPCHTAVKAPLSLAGR